MKYIKITLNKVLLFVVVCLPVSLSNTGICGGKEYRYLELVGGYLYTAAYDINNNGAIVGEGGSDMTITSPFIYTADNYDDVLPLHGNGLALMA